ncbi:MAG: hypothetical protein WA862_12850 [Solirubrobacterales bacterium]
MPEAPARSPFLPIYLNDHLAGSVVGVQLARRARASNEGTELGRVLAELCAEIEADQATLRRLMERLGVAESKVKPAGAWLGERLGRLKLNGQLRGYSPLSRVVELEGLCGGIAGKRQLWEAMERTFGARLSGFDFRALAERAAAQLARLEARRLDAAGEAFAAAPR